MSKSALRRLYMPQVNVIEFINSILFTNYVGKVSSLCVRCFAGCVCLCRVRSPCHIVRKQGIFFFSVSILMLFSCIHLVSDGGRWANTNFGLTLYRKDSHHFYFGCFSVAFLSFYGKYIVLMRRQKHPHQPHRSYNFCIEIWQSLLSVCQLISRWTVLLANIYAE